MLTILLSPYLGKLEAMRAFYWLSLQFSPLAVQVNLPWPLLTKRLCPTNCSKHLAARCEPPHPECIGLTVQISCYLPLTACTASNCLQLAASWPDSEIRPTGRVKKMTPDRGAGLVPMSFTLSEGSKKLLHAAGNKSSTFRRWCEEGMQPLLFQQGLFCLFPRGVEDLICNHTSYKRGALKWEEHPESCVMLCICLLRNKIMLSFLHGYSLSLNGKRSQRHNVSSPYLP